jgi:hypothetical protein
MRKRRKKERKNKRIKASKQEYHHVVVLGDVVLRCEYSAISRVAALSQWLA